MKKALLTSILFVCFYTILVAQDKIGVGIMSFTYVDDAASYENVNSIQETVTNAFVKTKRFNIVDRSKMDALKREKELQKTEDFIDGSTIEQSANLGASFLIAGHVISATTEQMESAPDDNGNVKISYRAKLAISLKVIDVATGQVVTSETIEPQGGTGLGGLLGTGPATPQAAMTKAINDIVGKVDFFVDKNFPVSFSIVEIQEKDGKGNAKVVMIAGGSDFNLQKGDKLQVVEVTEIEVNGKKLERKKPIGELKISRVEGESFSICTVSSGGIEINSKFESKSKLFVTTKF